MMDSNSPLEGQVQVDEEDSEPVSNLVGCAGELSGHGSETRGGYDDTHEARDVHAATRVDFVVEPGAQRVVNQTWIEISTRKSLLASISLLTSCGQPNGTQKQWHATLHAQVGVKQNGVVVLTLLAQ